MNHDQFKKCIGQTLRLEPRAIGPDDRPVTFYLLLEPVSRALSLVAAALRLV